MVLPVCPGSCASSRCSDGVQCHARGSVVSSSPAFATTAPRYPPGSGLDGKPRLLRPARSEAGGDDQRDSTGLQAAGAHHAS